MIQRNYELCKGTLKAGIVFLLTKEAYRHIGTIAITALGTRKSHHMTVYTGLLSHTIGPTDL